ncbi:tyrosine-type recombinase/integrase [Shinella sp. BYT-45]|uniref:tyrosine-type recombinase/integrase n=1 Tax=Shinella sp. BYT-45 TaxID=3377377 RepID=UPI00398118C8
MVLPLKGLSKVKKTLASGKTIYYCYAWRKGPLLKNKKGEPMQPDDVGLQAAFDAAHDRLRHPHPETVHGLITTYLGSSDFRSKVAQTRRHYAGYLDIIRDEFGALTFGDLEAMQTRGRFKSWRDTMADTPRKADFAWSVLSRVLSFGKDRGMLSRNIAERGGRLYRADRRESIWTDADIAAFNAVAGQELRLALLLALWTGQRKGDLLALKWAAYDGASFRLKQSKTGRLVAIPASSAVRAALETIPRPCPAVLCNSRGKPWTEAGFNTSWRKAITASGVEGLTFHDLRGTTVTRLALAGCSIAEIGAITGHSPKDIDAILHAHYLGGQRELAAQAMNKWEHR